VAAARRAHAAADRPWVSGTSDNSILSLILGYNGLGRIAGQAGGPQSFGGGGPGAGGPGGAGGVFGGETGPLRLLDASLGGQAGWLLGFALVVGVAILVASRLCRSDARTGWLLAVGGAFLTTAVAFSYAKGIFHPYYVSLLAPLTAALAGAGAGQLRAGDRIGRVLGPLAVVAGVAAELVVLGHDDASLAWLPQLLLPIAVLGAVALAVRMPGRVRAAALAVVVGVLLVAPASWAVQTLGHATNGTFPAGGLAAAGFGGGPGGGRGPGGPGGPPAGFGAPGRFAPGGGFGGGRAGGGGPFGGDSTALAAALSYVRSHGGGTIAVSSQQGAAQTIISTGADVAALGGFSGRESEVSVAWLADAVRAGKVRWVLADRAGGGFARDGRTGSSTVMAAVAQTCRPVSTSSTSASGLYDCLGRADALAAAS
jgi:4-amino-4-deoxy-L-arabinose transferase-like glycosyltransferase